MIFTKSATEGVRIREKRIFPAKWLWFMIEYFVGENLISFMIELLFFLLSERRVSGESEHKR